MNHGGVISCLCPQKKVVNKTHKDVETNTYFRETKVIFYVIDTKTGIVLIESE